MVTLVKEEPLPADAPPLPEENQSEDMAVDTDGGEGPTKSVIFIFTDHFVAFTCRNR